MSDVRSEFWDIVKCMLISLVILGHILEFGQDNTSRALYHFIYLFHMPCFAFVSGYFTKGYDSFKNFKKKNQKTIETLFSFHVLFTALELWGGATFSLSMLMVPYWILWYLFSLLCWRLIIKCTYMLESWKCILVSIICCLISGFVPLTYEFSFQRTLYFLPFFMLGHYWRVIENSTKKYIRISSEFACFIICIALLNCFIIVGIYDRTFYGFLYGSYNYIGLGINGMIVRCLFLFVSFIVSLSVFSACRLLKANEIVLRIGENTMFYFIYHVPCIWAIRILISVLHLPMEFPFLMIYYIGVMSILYMLAQIRLFHSLLTPISYIMQK